MKKLLLIEDDTSLRENTRQFLERCNYQVFSAANGKAGVEMALQHQPDLIVCDIYLPVLDGYGVFNSLNKNDATNTIPFIFLSAKKESGGHRKRINAPSNDHVAKPFKKEELIYRIESHFSRETVPKRKINVVPAIDTIDQLCEYFKDKGDFYKVQKNKLIFRENKKANFIYFIDKGLVKTHRMDDVGKELITGLYKKEDVFGFYYFKNSFLYPESASALENSKLYRLPAFKFQEIVAKNHELTIELAQLLLENMSSLKSHMLEMAYSSVLKKTTTTIIQFAEILQDSPKETVKISRNDLANVAGVSTESFIRSLSYLKKEGLIDIEGRDIKILNLQKLYDIK